MPSKFTREIKQLSRAPRITPKQRAEAKHAMTKLWLRIKINELEKKLARCKKALKKQTTKRSKR